MGATSVPRGLANVTKHLRPASSSGRAAGRRGCHHPLPRDARAAGGTPSGLEAGQPGSPGGRRAGSGRSVSRSCARAGRPGDRQGGVRAYPRGVRTKSERSRAAAAPRRVLRRSPRASEQADRRLVTSPALQRARAACAPHPHRAAALPPAALPTPRLPAGPGRPAVAELRSRRPRQRARAAAPRAGTCAAPAPAARAAQPAAPSALPAARCCAS